MLSVEHDKRKQLETDLEVQMTKYNSEKQKLEYDTKQAQIIHEKYETLSIEYQETTDRLTKDLEKYKEISQKNSFELEKNKEELSRVESNFANIAKSLEMSESQIKDLQSKEERLVSEFSNTNAKLVEFSIENSHLKDKVILLENDLKTVQDSQIELTVQLNTKVILTHDT